MRALVTGGAGFIGHHLVRALLDGGHAVTVLDDFSSGLRSRLQPFGETVRIVEGSVTDADALDAAIADCEVVFHLAAVASVERSLVEPVLTDEINVGGTIAVVLAAARQDVRRVILASSSATYGVPDALPCRETMRPAPASPYGVGKLAAEGYLHTLGAHLAVETVALRLFNVYGPGQDPHSDYAAVIPLFITAVLDGQRPVINGDGGITRDFVHVDDVAAAMLLAASSPGIAGRTFNIASGEETSLLDLLAAIGAAAGGVVEPRFGPPRPGDIRHSVADVSLAQDHLGFRVETALSHGIRRTVEHYRAERPGSFGA